MQSDRTETNDLAAQMPEKLSQLKAKWLAFAKKSSFLPVYGGRGAKKPKAKKK